MASDNVSTPASLGDLEQQQQSAQIVALGRRVDEMERHDRKGEQHVQNLTGRVDRIDQILPEVNEKVFLLESRVDKFHKIATNVLLPSPPPQQSPSPVPQVKSMVNQPNDVNPSLYQATKRDAIAAYEVDPDDEIENDSEEEDEEEDEDERQLRLAHINQHTVATLKKLSNGTSGVDIPTAISLLVEQAVTQNYEIRRLKKDARRRQRLYDMLKDKFRLLSYNHEVRVGTVEERVRLISEDTFLADYADYLDKRGYYFPDSLDKHNHRDRLTYPDSWSKESNTRMETDSKSSNAASSSVRPSPPQTSGNNSVMMTPASRTGNTTSTVSTGGPVNMITSSTSASQSVPFGHYPAPEEVVDTRSDFIWHTPVIETESPPSPQFARINLEIGFFKAKFLYGLFIKLRHIKNIREVMSRPDTLPIVEALPAQAADMTANNKVLLLEWQTNRAKKLNGVQRFKFDGVPVIPEGGESFKVGSFFLEEKEPIRVIQDKLPIRLMQYETSFGPTKKRLLKVPHVTLDNRRKYYIVCPADYWPVYEIWEMNGPRPLQDRHALVYRSPESVPGAFSGSPMVPSVLYGGYNDSYQGQAPDADGDDEDEESAHYSGQNYPGLNAGASPYRPSPPQSGEWSSDARQQSHEDNSVLAQFAGYWQGDVSMNIAQSGSNFICSLRLSISFPSLAIGQESNSDQQISVSHSSTDEPSAIAGAQHTALSHIRRDFHPYWTMFVLQPVPFSEAYCQFLQFYLPKKTPDEKIRKWFEMRQSQSGLSMCRVRYGEEMKNFETSQSADPNEAREDASFLAMIQVQSQYPNCFLIARPSGIDDTEAMNSYVRIHSSFNEEYFIERQSGSARQWVFRDLIVAEGSSQQAAKTILGSMEIICRSRIQKRLNISRRFEQILRGGASPLSSESELFVDPATAPTKASIHQLNMLNKKSATPARAKFEEFPETVDPFVGEQKRMTAQAAPFVPLGLAQPSPTSRVPELKQSPPKENVLKAESPSFFPNTAKQPQPVVQTVNPPASQTVNPSVNAPRPFTAPPPPATRESQPMYLSHPSQLSQPSQPSQPSQLSQPSQPSQSRNSDAMLESQASQLSRPHQSQTDTSASQHDSRMSTGNPTDSVSGLNNSGQGQSLTTGSTSRATTAQTGGDQKMDLASAVAVFENIGVPPCFFDPKATAFQRLQPWLQQIFRVPLAKTDDCFTLSPQGDRIRATLMFENQEFATFVAGDPTKAKEATSKIALLNLLRDPRFYRNLLLKIPPDSDANPTSTLLQFFQLYSIHKQGDELQGIYRSYMHTSGNSMPLFECRLTFKGTELGHGRGDTKRRAREEASRKVLRKLAEAIALLDVDNVFRLTFRFRGADAIVDDKIAAAARINFPSMSTEIPIIERKQTESTPADKQLNRAGEPTQADKQLNRAGEFMPADKQTNRAGASGTHGTSTQRT